MISHVEKANRYIADVLECRIPACKWVKAACQRQIDDLARNWEYSFDVARAEDVCRFIERLPHVKGKWKGRIELEGFQCFVLTTVFGWVDGEGNRRYRTVYWEMPRKNAKSTIASGVGLYMLTADGEPGAEVYSAATTRDQAKIVWNDAKAQADKEVGFRERFGVVVRAHAIEVPATNSIFIPLSAEGDTLDGKNVHFAAVDELHAHRTREVWDVIESATGARSQPLLLAITTAGVNRAGICFEQRSYVCGILNEVLHRHGGLGYPVKGTSATDESVFGIIYTIDDEPHTLPDGTLAEADDWTTIEAAVKANPNYGKSVNPEKIHQALRKATQLASAQPNYLTKHLCIWSSVASAWMDMLAWRRNIETINGRPIRPEDCMDWECWIGLDLAATVDLTAEILLFRKRSDDGRFRYRVFGRYWLPEDRIESSGNSQYEGWQIAGILNACDGATIDTEEIEAQIRADAKTFKVREVCKDPWNSQDIGSRLVKDRINVVDVPQNTAHLSAAMKEVEAAVLSGRLTHNGDPILDWAASNVRAKQDPNENIFPRKEREESKIDPMTALFTAMNRAMVVPSKESYSARRPNGPLVLG